MTNINPRKPQALIDVPPGTPFLLGCSAWAAALGMSEFKDNTPIATYHKFIGEAPQVTPEQQAIFDRGHRWEEYIAQEITALFGIKLKKCNKAYVHPLCKYLICHPDRLMVGRHEGKRIGIEIKSSKSYMRKKWGEPETDEVPADYFIQCLGYMACGVCDEVWLFRFSDFELTRYVIKYDENRIVKLEKLLIPLVESFVRREVPAPSSWSEITEVFTDPQDDFMADDSMMALCEEYDKAKEDESEAKARKEKLRDSIVSKMGGKRNLVNAAGKKLHSYTSSERTNFDKDRFQEDNPELYEKYTYKKTVMSFR